MCVSPPKNKNKSTPGCSLLGSVRFFFVFYIRAFNLLLGPALKSNFWQYFNCIPRSTWRMKNVPRSHCGVYFCRNARKKPQQRENATATKKCRKSEPWLLGTSWLSAQQLHILLRSAPPNLLAMSCGTSDFV